MNKIDEKIARRAGRDALAYTRYSDDLTFSTRNDYSRCQAKALIHAVGDELRAKGLYLNTRKTAVIPPGARKVVLGLLVDGGKPRLSRQFRSSLRQHLYFLEKIGPIEHMKRREYETVLGMKHHIRGHIDFAKMVDLQYAEEMLLRFEKVDWPV